MPPFLLSAITFSIGTCVGLVARLFMPAPAKPQKIPPQVWLIGIAGLFGYHFFYFTALRNAPAVEASLIAYLWPLLIVLGSALMPGERLRWNHIAGALLGLAGTVLIVTKGGGLAFDAPLRLRLCHGRRLRLPVVGLFASVAALPVGADHHRHLVLRWRPRSCRLLCHLALEETVLPANAGQWLAVLGLGLMPVGAAFYAWDIGVKRGNIQVLGAASYAAPLLSTLVLIVAGFAEPSPAHPRRLRAHHRRRGARGQVADLRRATPARGRRDGARGLTPNSGSQPGAASSNCGEVEARRHGAADQRPVARGCAAVCHQPAGTHHLRPLAGGEVGAEPVRDDAAVRLMQRERDRRTGMEMPDLGGVPDPVPGRGVAVLQQEVDRGRMAARPWTPPSGLSRKVSAYQPPSGWRSCRAWR